MADPAGGNHSPERAEPGEDPTPPAAQPPVWGRPSPASRAAWALRAQAEAGSAAVRADGGEAGEWALRAASLSGVRHRTSGTGPEDAYAWSVQGEDLVVAVADGVSSMEGSEAAASRAAAAAVAAADFGSALEDANRAAGEAGGATTLVAARLAPGGGVALRRVGDSSAFVLSGGRWAEVWDPAGEDGTGDDGPISTATLALPADGPVWEEAAAVLAPGDVLVLVTDGVADPVRDGPTTVAPGLAEALGARPGPLELARVLDFSRQGCHDDRTLLAVWMR